MLWRACRDGDVTVLYGLSYIGAQVNASNKISPSTVMFPFDLRTWTAMHFAASYGHAPCVNKLSKLGGDVNARTRTHGWTPLHYAAHDGYDDVCTALLNNGANVSARTNGDGATAMHFAAMNVGVDVCMYVCVRVGAYVCMHLHFAAMDVCVVD